MDDMKRTSEYRRMLPFIAKASNDVGDDTQGEDIQALILALNTHKSSTDHDGRYYTETEVGTLFTNHNSSGDHDGRYYTETETNNLLGYKADKTITLTAGNGLTGGGTLAADRTFAVGAGTGITVNANDVAIDLTANLTWTGLHTFSNTLTTRSILPALSDVYDLGDYTKPWRKIWGSELSAVVFSQYEQVLLGGWLTISKGEGKLGAIALSGDLWMNLGDGSYADGDILVFRGISSNGTPQVEYIKVGSGVSGDFRSVTRDLDGTGANTWLAGTIFANWGQVGNGRVELNAYDTPRMSVYSHGAAIADFREQLRFGDLNGGWGYSSSVFGGAFGSYESGKANITIDPTNGLRIRNYNVDVIKLTGTEASFENFITLGANGGIRQGTGTWGSSFTGTAMWNESGVMNVGGWNAGVKQWWGGSDGTLRAGDGKVILDDTGIYLVAETPVMGTVYNTINWLDGLYEWLGAGSSVVFRIGSELNTVNDVTTVTSFINSDTDKSILAITSQGAEVGSAQINISTSAGMLSPNHKAHASIDLYAYEVGGTKEGQIIYEAPRGHTFVGPVYHGSKPANMTDDGWIPVSSTWTYASATTINVPSGAAAIYTVGQGVKLKHNGAQNWFYITAVADTQLTITGGSDYPFTSSGSNTLSEISYTNTPSTAIGFPSAFNYTPTGISSSNVTLSGSFSVSANRCWVSFLARFTGAITYTGAPTLPIPVGSVYANYYGSAMALTSSTGGYIDAGTGITLGSLFVTALSGATAFNIYSASGVQLSATSPITWANNDGIRIEFSYPI